MNGGSIILNKDDKFYNYLKFKAIKKNLKIFSFSMKNKNSYSNLDKVVRIGKKFKILLKVNSKKYFYYSNFNSQNYIQNLLAAITTISLFFDLRNISKNIFLNFKTPVGRGDFSKLKFKNKIINFIDESYNSNPLSLKNALNNFSKMKIKKNAKHVLLGDMLELGESSINHHKSIAKIINKLDIHQVHIFGKDIRKTYEVLKKNKQGVIIRNLSKINDLILKTLNTNDYLMIKGSNSTGLFKQSQLLKLNRLYAL